MSSSLSTLTLLEPYVPTPARPWDARRAQHFFQRIAFGANLDTLQQALAMSPGELVDQFIDNLVALPPPEPPAFANWTWDDYGSDTDLYFEHKRELTARWMREIVSGDPRAKLAMFWHSHFATEEDVYDCPSFKWVYYDLLFKHSTGNFRAFVEAMGVNAAMLVYLNGNINVAGQPNENYARELMELFTMGESNGYTQTDIVEVARALTGWRVNMYACNNNVTFDPGRHDNGPKTIFGQTGNWHYDDVHELIFTLRREQVARYICSKLYRFFVYQIPDWTVIDEMATTFKDNNWELAPVLRQLFKSAHFFDDRVINVRVKSPVECLVGPLRLLGMTYGDNVTDDWINNINYFAFQLGEDLYNPPDVAGWPGYHTWINENTLTTRWNYSSSVLYGSVVNSLLNRAKIRNWTIALMEGDIQAGAESVTAAIVRYFLKRDLSPRLQDVALQYFKGEVPGNYFEDGTWDLNYEDVPYQVTGLLYYLTRLPEWQLC
jgi:uncharacterized protein (DUF1800 family)